MYADIQINFPCNRFTDNSDLAFWASDKNETNYYYEYNVIQFFENTFFLLQKVDILYMLQKYMK